MSTDSSQPTGDDATASTDTLSNADGDESELEPGSKSFTATITVGYVQRFLDAIRALGDASAVLDLPSGVLLSGRDTCIDRDFTHVFGTVGSDI